MKRNWLQIAMLIVALLAVNLQCLARCADEHCTSRGKSGKKPPPCHRQQPAKQVETPCAQAPVADVRGAQGGELPLTGFVCALPAAYRFEFSLPAVERPPLAMDTLAESWGAPLTIHLRI